MQNNWYKNINKKIVREWFQLADEDFKYAEDTFRETENYRMICFVCQQVVEKYLKGYLQFKNIVIIVENEFRRNKQHKKQGTPIHKTIIHFEGKPN